MFHRSERLLLRPPWPEDWRAVLDGLADEQVVRNLARAPWPYREDHAREFLALGIEPLYPRFMITRAQDGIVVGCVRIDRDDAEGQAGGTELGYWIARAHWGKGYATEAGQAVLDVARMLGHSRIVAGHFLDNPASGRVLRKLGFVANGIVRDRHSRGRDGKAPLAEYSIALESDAHIGRQAA